jgi:hypothetical protein
MFSGPCVGWHGYTPKRPVFEWRIFQITEDATKAALFPQVLIIQPSVDEDDREYNLADCPLPAAIKFMAIDVIRAYSLTPTLQA